MTQGKIQVKPAAPLMIPQRPSVRQIGSTVIARFPSCMLKAPRPARPLPKDK
jgi:hypothetical protein